MTNILVTGAGGFIGQRLVQQLQDGSKNVVVCMTRDRPGYLEPCPPNRIFVAGDLLDFDFCRRVIADYKIDQIYHLAAQSIVRKCAEDPIGALRSNVIGTARLLEATRQSGRDISTVVMTSDKAYGHAPSPYTEDTPLDARHAYDVSKACQDLVARMYATNYGMRVMVTRAVNVYGPGDPNGSRLIPNTVRRMLNGERPEIHPGSNDMRRQYVYVDDVCAALSLVMDKGVAGDAYGIGGPDDPMTVEHVVRLIASKFDRPFEAASTDRPDTFKEIESQAIDDTKLRRMGWAPTVDFRAGLGRVIEDCRRSL